MITNKWRLLIWSLGNHCAPFTGESQIPTLSDPAIHLASSLGKATSIPVSASNFAEDENQDQDSWPARSAHVTHVCRYRMRRNTQHDTNHTRIHAQRISGHTHTSLSRDTNLQRGSRAYDFADVQSLWATRWYPIRRQYSPNVIFLSTSILSAGSKREAGRQSVICIREWSILMGYLIVIFFLRL